MPAPPHVRRLHLIPVSLRDARLFVRLHHRHLGPPVGHKFSLGCRDDHEMRGVVIVGRPVARMLDDGLTLEVLRCTVMPGTPNGASLLLAAAWAAAKHLGFTRLITYTLPSEGGVSLRAAGMRAVRQTGGGEWSRPSRGRNAARNAQVKTHWEATRMPGRTVTVDFKAATRFLSEHGHAPISPGQFKFCLGVQQGAAALQALLIIGPPCRGLHQDGMTLEVQMFAALPGTPECERLLQRAAWKATRALGYARLITVPATSRHAPARPNAARVIGVPAAPDAAHHNPHNRLRLTVRHPQAPTLWEAAWPEEEES